MCVQMTVLGNFIFFIYINMRSVRHSINKFKFINNLMNLGPCVK
jgi:hypothetical protein